MSVYISRLKNAAREAHQVNFGSDDEQINSIARKVVDGSVDWFQRKIGEIRINEDKPFHYEGRLAVSIDKYLDDEAEKALAKNEYMDVITAAHRILKRQFPDWTTKVIPTDPDLPKKKFCLSIGYDCHSMLESLQSLEEKELFSRSPINLSILPKLKRELQEVSKERVDILRSETLQRASYLVQVHLENGRANFSFPLKFAGAISYLHSPKVPIYDRSRRASDIEKIVLRNQILEKIEKIHICLWPIIDRHTNSK